MGSVIAAQYAAGVTPAAMLAVNRLWEKHTPMRDLTLPAIALVSGTSGLAMLETMFGDRRIEDLWLDYFCVSANLTRSEIVVHDHGPLRQWVRASIAIPGIVAPLRLDNGDLLVDGAILNNMPADVMRARGVGHTVAVDLTPPEAFPTDDYTDQPTTWQALRLLSSTWLRLGTPVRSPTLLSILFRTTLAASRALSERLKHEVDLYIAPPLDGIGLFDWNAVARVADIGYRATQRRLVEWPAPGRTPRTTPVARKGNTRALRRTGKPDAQHTAGRSRRSG